MHMIFKDRLEAGRLLSHSLQDYKDRPYTLVLAIPRGAVPLAFEVAKDLNAPLDVFVVRKLGVPEDPELAFGAIASGGVRVFNNDLLQSLSIPKSVIDRVTQEEEEELARRELKYRGGAAAPEVFGKTVLLIDDGIATGASIRAAVLALKQLHPKRLVLAVPTASQSALHLIRPLVDECIILSAPEPFRSVAQSYAAFPQVGDEEVVSLLKRSRDFGKARTDARPKLL